MGKDVSVAIRFLGVAFRLWMWIKRPMGAARFWLKDNIRYVRGIGLRSAPRTINCLTIPTPGLPLRMLLTRPGHIEDELVRNRVWEPHVTEALHFFMPEDGVFVDVGANIGYHSLFVARSLPRARVICFEPHPGIREELLRNVRANHAANVVVRTCAVGDRSDTVRFFAQTTSRSYNRGLSSVLANHDLGPATEAIDVDLRPLDVELAGERRIDVIKIDTQGLELEVLRGARVLIEAHRPVIVFELESSLLADPEATLAELGGILGGYCLFKLGPDIAELAPLSPTEVRRRSFERDVIALPPSFLASRLAAPPVPAGGGRHPPAAETATHTAPRAAIPRTRP